MEEGEESRVKGGETEKKGKQTRWEGGHCSAQHNACHIFSNDSCLMWRARPSTSGKSEGGTEEERDYGRRDREEREAF